jgi:hypothetical protein
VQHNANDSFEVVIGHSPFLFFGYDPILNGGLFCKIKTALTSDKG